MKLKKTNTCSCTKGFTGQFCDQKEEFDNLLYIELNKTLIFDPDGYIIDDNFYIESGLSIYRSCSTILNGEALIFGGYSWGSKNHSRQVSPTRNIFINPYLGQ